MPLSPPPLPAPPRHRRVEGHAIDPGRLFGLARNARMEDQTFTRTSWNNRPDPPGWPRRRAPVQHQPEMVTQPPAEDRFLFFGVHQINPYSFEIVTARPHFLTEKINFYGWKQASGLLFGRHARNRSKTDKRFTLAQPPATCVAQRNSADAEFNPRDAGATVNNIEFRAISSYCRM